MTEQEVRDRVDELFACIKADDPDGHVADAVVQLILQLILEWEG